ncbi:hypothetical protein IW261DRAFT_1595983 [Armillaria novae-zelandiae]|uniref:Uncharacterized protein n=1 Tax=Armillaria novae-zelandiae TaxID=153914 RepID=A0AA39NZE5_9AGAR|nr:hypothetical protein IW261DRAFT_1595983 [Armillaria novae-zelandiae]
MWTRLHAYVSLPVSFQHKNDPAIRERLFHLSECSNAPEFPPSSYEDGYRQMHAIEAIQSILPQPVLCNIEGVQDDYSNILMACVPQMRYENKADKLSPEATYIDSANMEVPAESGIISDEGNVFENGHNGNLLLKQLWGECADLGPDAGFTTNGDVVMIFFRVVPRSRKAYGGTRGSRSKTPQSTPDSGFVLSPLMKWNDTRLRACLLALSFMTLDKES